MEIGVCGYGYTGSGALFGLLKEFENIKVFSENELYLSYAPDGLEDLEYILCKNPSKGVKCDIGIYRFKLLVRDYAKSLNKDTNGVFSKAAIEYVRNISQVRWKAYRLFEYERQKHKGIGRAARYHIHMFFYRVFKKDILCFPLTERYLSICPDNFHVETRLFVKKVLESKGVYNCLLINQPFSANNPLNSMQFFPDPKCIYVDRDPRDLFIMCKYIYGKEAMFIPTDTVENFITYYRNVRKIVSDNERVLRLNFEELVYEYDDAIAKISNFLEGTIGSHTKKYEFFNPNISVKNTHVFSFYENEKESISKIEEELSSFLYQFPNDGNKSLSVDELRTFTFIED